MNQTTPVAPTQLGDQPVTRTTLDFGVVGIGASAGGIPALKKLLEKLPASTGMAFVIVLHLSPEHESALSQLLQASTALPVVQVIKPMMLEVDHVYVIPPNKHLFFNDGYIGIAEMTRPPGQHLAIDLFLRTLADVHLSHAFGVILSGAGGDGAAGLARVKEQGGVTIVQQPEEAEYDSMPLAAIATGSVDFILPAGEIAGKLLQLWRNAAAITLPPIDEDAVSPAPPGPRGDGDAEKALQKIFSVLRVHTGHDFRHYKRGTVLRRIERRMQVRGVSDLPSYLEALDTHQQEPAALLKDLLIGVTNFFRDPESFAALETLVIPELIHNKTVGKQIRVWVTACSTGEEAYSLAMLIRDATDKMPTPMPVQIFASDIDDRAISVARAGLYPASIALDVSTEQLQQHFTREDGRYAIRKTIRDSVLFASHNLLRDPPFSRLDLISCRNFLIYLNREIQAHLLEMFHFSLNPGGFLFLGGSESADLASHLFTPVDKKSRIYRAKPIARSTRYALSAPRGFTIPSVPEPSTPSPVPKQRQFSFAEVHQKVLSQYAPPSVIVNREYDIVHLSDRAGRFLRHTGGEPSRNLVLLVQPEIRLELRTALFQALQTGKSVDARSVKLSASGRTYFVNMTVRPFHDPDADTDLVLVLFDEVEQTMGSDSGATSATEGQTDAVLAQLEAELQRTKDQLRETVEQAEVSMEELRASNEELQAINEEMRSTTEELETSKEELQSVNEELVTVNFELKTKVEETGKVNDDLNNLIASADIATIFVDRGMRIKRYTPRAADIFNLISTDIGRSLLDITHRLDYPELADDATATFITLQPVEREVGNKLGRHYIARVLPYRTTEDRIEGAVMTFFDITSRRETEERLRAQEEQLRLAAESLRDYAIITLDQEGRITTWSHGAELLFGYAENEAVGQSGDIIFLDSDKKSDVFIEEMRRADKDGRVEDNRWHLRKDGSSVFCNGVMTPIVNGDFKGYAKIARNESRLLLQDNQRDATLINQQTGRRQAENAALKQNDFLAAVSHELRNPLNVIYMNAELLSRLPELQSSPAGSKAARTIHSAAASQARIIDDLLDISRLKTGRLALKIEEVELVAVLNGLVDNLKTSAARSRAISIHSDAASCVVQADRTRIEQAILTLLGTAIESTPDDGRIAITLTQAGQNIRLEVFDNGKGIAADLLAELFHLPEERTAEVSGRRRGGLGIGLALTRQIIELHGGRIDAESDGPGQGTRFIVLLPTSASPAGAPRLAAGRSSIIQGKRILVADDSSDTAASLKDLLEFDGAIVQIATSAAQVLDLLQTGDVDVLITEVALPDMDGYAMMRQIRQMPRHTELIAVAIVASGGIKEIEHARAAGYSAFIDKPVLIEKLLDRVAEVYDLRQSGQNAP